MTVCSDLGARAVPFRFTYTFTSSFTCGVEVCWKVECGIVESGMWTFPGLVNTLSEIVRCNTATHKFITRVVDGSKVIFFAITVRPKSDTM